jgi:ketosteroid isomerase-like protein
MLQPNPLPAITEEAPMQHRKRVLSSVLVLISVACAQQPATETAEVTETATADPATVRTHVDQFVSVWNAGDVGALGSMIAEDAVLMQPTGPALEGRESILADIAQGYDIALLQQSATVDEVIMLGEWAYARGTWNLDPTPEAGPEVPALSGKWSVVYQPAPDGGWQVWRWMWNQPPEQVAAAAQMTE